MTAGRFRDPEIRRRACKGYEEVQSRLLDPSTFADCEEAYRVLIDFVQRLPLAPPNEAA